MYPLECEKACNSGVDLIDRKSNSKGEFELEKVINVSLKYEKEIAEIHYILKELGDGRIYGFDGNCSQVDNSLETNVDKLTEKITDLLNKIEYGKDSSSDKITE